jgi:hypothetical protein
LPRFSLTITAPQLETLLDEVEKAVASSRRE